MSTSGRTAAGMRTICRTGLWALGAVAALALLAGCNGGTPHSGDGMISVDLAPIIQQMGGGSDKSSASANRVSPEAISGPGTTASTTDVLTLIVGAIIVDFTDTPLGPNTSLDTTTRNNIKNDAIDSIKFISLVQLPTGSDTISFLVPPAGSKHWQVIVAGTRDSVTTLDSIADDSVIWYGFNTDTSNNPFFLTSSTLGNQTINVTLTRACIANSKPPLGCAAFFTDRSAAVTDGVEITSVTVDGSIPILQNGYTFPIYLRANGSATANAANCHATTGCTAAAFASQWGGPTSQVIGDISTASTITVNTTHQLSASQVAPCTTDPNTSASQLAADCGVQSYTTNF
jgi:hypothetical protein